MNSLKPLEEQEKRNIHGLLIRNTGGLFKELSDACCEGKAGTGSHGYGSLWTGKRNMTAPRAAWRAFKGEIPNGLFVLHKCNNKLCVNLKHLYLGTHQQNVDDYMKVWRAENEKTCS